MAQGVEKEKANYHPPDMYGSRLLPAVLDQWARDEPHRLYALLPRTAHISDGFVQVTMQQMAHSVNATAWWLMETFGKAEDFQTLAYIGPSDLRYPVLTLAAIKGGWKLLLLGTRNAVSQNRQLLIRTGCTRILYAEEVASRVEGLQVVTQELSCHRFHSFEQIQATESAGFPWTKTFQEACDDPVLILHSSGTTGDPKLVTMTHGTFSATDLDRDMPVPTGRRAQNAALYQFDHGGNAYSCFPPYHLAGVLAYTILPIFYGPTAVFGPPDLPASGYLVSEIMRQIDLRAIYVPPGIIEEWTQRPEALEQAKRLDFILYGGGPLSPSTGDLLDEVCNICQVYGSAEIGLVQLLVPEKGNWAYLEPNPYEKLDMQSSEEHGAYEMVLQQCESLNSHRYFHYNFPGCNTWRTGDLFIQHREKPNLWSFHGRVDDLIVLSNSHKISPAPMETKIQGHPLVSGAIVIGTKRPRPSLLLETRERICSQDVGELIGRIWPVIEEVNASTPEYGQILRSMLVIASWDKPFSRAPKGSIVRSLTLEKYAREIEALYSQETSSPVDVSETMEDMIVSSITQFLFKCVVSLLPAVNITENDDLFHRGLDSLKVAELSNNIQGSLRGKKSSSRSGFSVDTVYRHPTIASLARAIYGTIVAGNNPRTDSIPRLEAVVEEHMKGLPHPKDVEGSKIVLMTGSTGTLGIHILQSVLREVQVSKVYCLTRSLDGRKVQISKFENQEAHGAVDMSKAEFLQVDLSQHHLGLDNNIWKRLTDSVDIIVHAAWNVNFNLPLQHYEAHHIKGLRTLIDLSIEAKGRPRIAFISSITSISNWNVVHGSTSVPEIFPNSYDLALDLGYSQSKLAAEFMLSIASDRCNIPVTLIRIGQIAGSVSRSTKGQWPRHEWIPLLAQTSKSLRLVPSFNAMCDWTPVDIVAKVIHEMLFRDPAQDRHVHSECVPRRPHKQVYNIANPLPNQCVPWSAFADILQRNLGGFAQVVSLHEWVEALKLRDVHSAQDLAVYPALKILPFFEALAAKEIGKTTSSLIFETNKAIEASDTMAHLQPVSTAWVEQWILDLEI